MSKAIHFRSLVIRPVLAKMGAGGPAAEELLLGTAIQESLCFMYRKQVGGGPALGYYQMEPSTHDDIWDNFLKYRPTLANNTIFFLSSKNANKHMELKNNDKYATAMARIHYMRVVFPIPKRGDLSAQANYWKRHYNTPLGRGRPHEYIQKWNKCVLTGC